jgi:peptidoglycan-N-acetylglucosamine deacetylase
VRRLLIGIAGVAGMLLLAAGLRMLARSRTYQLFSRPVSRVATSDSIVALTFDDGPTEARADSLLGLLRSRGVRVTFFLIGHELGNHTYTHNHMVFRTPATYRSEVARTDSLLRAAGARDPIFFRPPYGYKLVGLPYVLWRTGRTTVTWDIEPESYPDVARSADRIVRHVLERVRPGSIILLHPWYASGAPTRAAIPALIDSLRARGYALATVGELLARTRR